MTSRTRRVSPLTVGTLGTWLFLATLGGFVACSSSRSPTNDAPRAAGSGVHQVAPQSVSLTRDSRAKARETAVAAYLAGPSPQSGVALAHAYFPELVATQTAQGASSREAFHALTVSPAGSAITLATRGHVFRVESGATPQWGSDVAALGDGHFLAPAGRSSGAATAGAAWKTSRLEEYWVRNEASGEQRAEYDVTLPEGVRRLHQTADFIEFLDASGVAVLRFHPSVVRDAQGQTRTGRVQISGATRTASGRFEAGAHVHLATTVSLAGLRAPLVVDPGWSSTASMAHARWSHDTTLLPSGKLLATGGTDFNGPVATAELYDPESDTWTAASSMHSARALHTATLLPSGQVLIAGGSDFNGALATAELYDPATDTWINAAGPSTSRQSHTATLLASGEVLVVGGFDAKYNDLSSAELYDPTADAWSSAGSLMTARAYHTATLLPSGKVLVAAGRGSQQTPLASAEVYDPTTSTWSSTGSLATARDTFTATLLPSGQVLVAGGTTGNSPTGTTSAELYDPATQTWSPAASMNTSRSIHAATLLPNGNVLISGGNPHPTSTELYDPLANTWTSTTDLNTGRFYATTTLLPSGKVMIVGGTPDYGTPLASTETYDPAASAWGSAADLTVAPVGHTATLLPSGKVLVVGGRGTSTGGNALITTAELYDPPTDTWTSAASPITPRESHTATLLPSGQVLVVGGQDQRYNAIATAELYDPATDSWTPAASMSTARAYHTATLLASGQVLVAGGANALTFYSSAELYDPATNTWTPAGNMATAHMYHVATLLPSGQVLVAGGENVAFEPTLSSAELYDPTTNTWTTTGSMTSPRERFMVSPLPSGKVFVAGGSGGIDIGAVSSAEVYDPASGTWTAVAGLPTALYGQTQTLLPSGRVLVAGGMASGDSAACELYDPATNTWTAVANLGTARDSHVATLLPSGKVLVTGGISMNGAAYGIPQVELYNDTGAQDTWRPVVTPPGTLSSGSRVTLSGTGFRGLSGASGGGGSDSPTDFPFVTLQAVDGQQLFILPGTGFSATGVTVTIPALGNGYYVTSVTANAISGGTVALGKLHLAPVASNGSASTDVDEAVAVNLVATAQNNAPVTYSIVSTPAHGTLSGTAPALTYTPAAGYVGSDSFTFKANDGVADSNLATFSLTVTDTAPTVMVPAPITAEATSASGAAVTFTATATDAADGATTVTCSPASGSTFPLGPTTVTCSSTDSHSHTGTATFTVTVVDTTPPALTVPSPITAEATSASGAAVTFTATATDLVDGATSVACTPASGSTFAPGATTVSCKSEDARHNEATATFTVTVVDTTAPTLGLPADITAQATDATGAIVNFTPTAVDLVDGTDAVTCTPASGAHFNDGLTTVTCSAQDAAMNKATGTFQVTVVRTAITAPTLVTPAAGAKLANGLVAFSWTASTAPAGVSVFYTLTITTAAGTAVTKPVDGTSLTLTADAALAAGDYSWQVAAIDSRDNKGVSSPTGQFTVLAASGGAKKSGCGCSSSPSDGLANIALYVLLGAAMLRPRRSVRRA